jgi:anaerobic magnesium-protoporphyrin IX monomethyl ester cyclase
MTFVAQPRQVLLIRPPDPLQEAALLSHTRPMNLAALAAFLREAGFTIAICDYEVTPYHPTHLRNLLQQLQPAVVGISCTTPTISNGGRVAAEIKALAPEILTVVGGPHPSALPEQTLREFAGFDCLVCGEGEMTLLELCRGDNFPDILGLVWRDGKKIMINAPRPLLANLDLLPFPARDLLPALPQAGHSSRGFGNALRSTELYTSRGCPFACSFCAIQATFGRNVRFRSPASIAAELAEIARIAPVEHLVIADDTFTLDPERATEICGIIGRSGITSWNCDTRVSSVTPELLRTMRQNGCTKVAFGVEAGSQRILDKIGKKIQAEQVGQAVAWAKEAGLRHIEGNFIIGADPSETVEDLELTRRMILDLPWTFVSVAVIVPYPGTPIYQQMSAAGQIDAAASWDDFVMFGRTPRWRTDNFSGSELIARQRALTRAFYLRPSYIAGRLAGIRSWTEVRYWFGAGTAYLKWYWSGTA